MTRTGALLAEESTQTKRPAGVKATGGVRRVRRVARDSLAGKGDRRGGQEERKQGD